jgi:SAM-dependent methyltransferase
MLVDDITPYKKRKVGILNGGHTALVPLALLAGLETVGAAVNDPQVGGYLADTLAHWRGQPLTILHNDNPDVAVARGAVAYALARRGHPVDAVEMTGGFADIIRAEAAKESLNIRVLQRDVFATLEDLRTDYQLIVLSEVVSDFRNTEQLRALFELAARCLAPEGRLLFNIFLVRSGHTVDDAARELGQQAYTTIFTPAELASASSKLPLELIADDSVHDYEKTHQPAENWPPTSWYANWTTGLDVFDLPVEECPIEMRWLVYRKN